MTKLAEWLTALVLLLSLWWATSNGKVAPEWSARNPIVATWWPLAALFLFGLYCLATIVYRVATFNDCPEAAEELKRDIAEARKELKAKGVEL